MRGVHRLRPSSLVVSSSPLASCARASPSCCIALPSASAALTLTTTHHAHFHSATPAHFAAPAAKPAAAGGKPGAAGAASASALLTPPAPNSKRWVQEGWNAPRLVPVVHAAQKVNAAGLVVPADAASDAAEMAEARVLPVLHAEVREGAGSKFSQHLRKQRMRIPGIICDRAAPRQNQLLVSLDRFELEDLSRRFRRTLGHKVCLIKIEGQEPIKVIADELVRHAVTQELQVANWFLFKPNQEKVRVKMPIVYTGTEECIGVKRGGVIVILRDHVPCVWTGDEHIPSFIHIDMANTDGGKVFRNADLQMAPGLRLADPKFDYIVATVLGVKSKDGNVQEEVVTGEVAPAAHQPSAIQLEREKKEKERREEEEMVAQKLAQKAAKTGKK